MPKPKSRREKESRWNARNIVAITVISALVLGIVLFVPEFALMKTDEEDFDLGANAACAVTVEYYGYYEGDVVAIPPIENAPWSIGGQAIDELAIDVSWVVAGDYMDWTTLMVSGELHLYVLDYAGRNPVEITPYLVDSAFVFSGESVMIDSTSYRISLANLLSGVTPTFSGPDEVYWHIQAIIEVTARATDDYGASHQDSTGVMEATYTIYDVAGEGLTINGDIT